MGAGGREGGDKEDYQPMCYYLGGYYLERKKIWDIGVMMGTRADVRIKTNVGKWKAWMQKSYRETIQPDKGRRPDRAQSEPTPVRAHRRVGILKLTHSGLLGCRWKGLEL